MESPPPERNTNIGHHIELIIGPLGRSQHAAVPLLAPLVKLERSSYEPPGSYNRPVERTDDAGSPVQQFEHFPGLQPYQTHARDRGRQIDHVPPGYLQTRPGPIGGLATRRNSKWVAIPVLHIRYPKIRKNPAVAWNSDREQTTNSVADPTLSLHPTVEKDWGISAGSKRRTATIISREAPLPEVQ